jgi:V8-like Glu-specific endopeptidase
MRSRPVRTAAVTAAAAAVLLMSGCVLPSPPPPVTTRQPQQPPSQPSQPVPSSGAPDIEVVPVEPDEPITLTDETDADTGELYAGSDGETVDGFFPDAALDLVLEPTRGAAQVAPGIALPVTDEGDELLAGTEPTADGNLLLSTVGRLLLGTESGDYTCSGTVINSESGLVVITAAHCVFDDETRDYYDRISFEPGYERGDAPFGTWVAEDWWVPEQYLEANDRWLDGADDDGWMGFDFGFIRFAPQDGRTLEDVVGGQGVSFTAETNGVVIAGYPGNDPFDAEVLRYCADDELNYGAGGDANYGADCVMGDGASGSGFVSNLDPETGAGHITAVYSNGGETGAYGPPLGVTAHNGLLSLGG